MADSSITWRRYQRLADHPDWFTRWMLERTLAALHYLQDQDTDKQGNLPWPALIHALETALHRRPLPPPQSLDARVDLLHVKLDAVMSQLLVDVFDAPAAQLADVPLDESQRARKNPWGGFREAWLGHYNQGIGNRKGSGEMADSEVLSEVAGTVWKVHVAVGDTVAQDQELMILESMKMEIPVDAPCAGKVASVLVSPEDGIEEDQVLLVIEH